MSASHILACTCQAENKQCQCGGQVPAVRGTRQCISILRGLGFQKYCMPTKDILGSAMSECVIVVRMEASWHERRMPGGALLVITRSRASDNRCACGRSALPGCQLLHVVKEQKAWDPSRPFLSRYWIVRAPIHKGTSDLRYSRHSTREVSSS